MAKIETHTRYTLSDLSDEEMALIRQGLVLFGSEKAMALLASLDDRHLTLRSAPIGAPTITADLPPHLRPDQFQTPLAPASLSEAAQREVELLSSKYGSQVRLATPED